MNQPSQLLSNTNLFKPPSAIIYSRDFEPISHVPMNAQMYQYFMQYEVVRFPVMLPVDINAEPTIVHTPIYAEIMGMKVHSSDGMRLILIARDDNTALLMNNTFLPGQTKEVNFIKSKAFFQGMINAMKAKK
jgi:hypothetical protein